MSQLGRIPEVREREVLAHSSVGDVCNAGITLDVEVGIGGSQRLGDGQFQAHIARSLQQYLLVFQRLYVPFLVKHNPAAFVVNVVLM